MKTTAITFESHGATISLYHLNSGDIKLELRQVGTSKPVVLNMTADEWRVVGGHISQMLMQREPGLQEYGRDFDPLTKKFTHQEISNCGLCGQKNGAHTAECHTMICKQQARVTNNGRDGHND